MINQNQEASPSPPSTPQASPSTEAVLGQLSTTLTAVQDFLKGYGTTKRRERSFHTARILFYIVLVLGTAGFYLLSFAHVSGFKLGPREDRTVAVIPISGEIAQDLDASADKVIPLIDRACALSKVDTIMLQISSGGGSPSESERIGSAIDHCKAGDKEHRGKRVIALIDGVGASGAYLIAMHADKIYAGRYTLVGSIGAIIRIPDASALAKTLGVQEHTYRSSPGKGGPSLLTGPNPADDLMFQKLVGEASDMFTADLIRYRGNKLKQPAKSLATGEIWPAEQALQIGLIDGVANREQLHYSEFRGEPYYDYKVDTGLSGGLGVHAAVHDLFDAIRTELAR